MNNVTTAIKHKGAFFNNATQQEVVTDCDCREGGPQWVD
jgi:hypothetical protein